jgi:hypothetical protein
MKLIALKWKLRSKNVFFFCTEIGARRNMGTTKYDMFVVDMISWKEAVSFTDRRNFPTGIQKVIDRLELGLVMRGEVPLGGIFERGNQYKTMRVEIIEF